MKLWWISWCQDGADYRPVKWPPPDGVLAFWCTGYGDNYATVVALVRAPTYDKAAHIIKRAWSPGVGEFRFNREYGDETKPPGDRFPAPEWSVAMERWPWRGANHG